MLRYLEKDPESERPEKKGKEKGKKKFGTYNRKNVKILAGNRQNLEGYSRDPGSDQNMVRE